MLKPSGTVSCRYKNQTGYTRCGRSGDLYWIDFGWVESDAKEGNYESVPDDITRLRRDNISRSVALRADIHNFSAQHSKYRDEGCYTERHRKD